jgi:hypothetical protein
MSFKTGDLLIYTNDLPMNLVVKKPKKHQYDSGFEVFCKINKGDTVVYIEADVIEFYGHPMTEILYETNVVLTENCTTEYWEKINDQ